MANMERVKWSEHIDLSDWDFAGDDEEWSARFLTTPIAMGVLALAAAIITRKLRAEFRLQPPDITMPITWSKSGDDGIGGPPPDDPLTLYLGLPMGESGSDGDACYWAVSFKDVAWDVVNDHIAGKEGQEWINDEGRDKIKLVAKHLRELAEEMEDACATTASAPPEGP
jgi:hypothetical protein